MAVIVKSPVEGLSPGDIYEGPNEAWYLENGYAAAVNPEDVPDLDHPEVPLDDYPEEDVTPVDLPTASEQRYGPEVALETVVQSPAGEARLDQIRSTKGNRPYSSDPKPEEEPAPEEEPPVEEEPTP